ncbi:MAG TPA: hypothetical protein VGQ06_05125 [Gemmatimonadales bacterium]|nr:hypothetical protein [Gemmatimonadales bacterium]
MALVLGLFAVWAVAMQFGSGEEGGGDHAPLRLRATVVHPPPSSAVPPDTIRFAVPAVAHRCGHGRSLLLEGAGERGNGVLVLLRYGDSLTPGVFPVIALGDSLTLRGAAVAVRYMIRDVAHGLALDSGTVELRDLRGARDSVAARVGGAGLESAVRVTLEAEYAAVPFAADTVPCRYRP